MTHQRRVLRRKHRRHHQDEQETPHHIDTSSPDVDKIMSLYNADPQHSQNQKNIMQLQRTLGNKKVMSLLKENSLQREDQDDQSKNSDPSKQDFEDFDGKQYRVTGKAPDRKVQEVKRMTTVKGEVYYVALGEVVEFSGQKPVIKYYNTPIDLGDWYPKVTHVNGMNVKTQEGIEDAMLLQQNLNEEIEKAGDDDVALGQDAVDVLYTYSATSGMFFDVINCIKGKFGFNDKVIRMQTQMMIDAVMNKQKVHVSAHSRGTIKTDNAVRNAYAYLSKHYIPEIWEQVLSVLEIPEEHKGMFAAVIADIAKSRAGEEMDKYIHLIYAGNAVEFPSTALPVDFVVGSYDAVSLMFGTVSQWGVEKWSFPSQGHDKSKMHGVSGGHSFAGYIPTVAEIIGQEIVKEQEKVEKTD